MGRLSIEEKEVLRQVKLIILKIADVYGFYTNNDYSISINGVPSQFDGGGTKKFTATPCSNEEKKTSKFLDESDISCKIGINNLDIRDLVLNSNTKSGKAYIYQCYLDPVDMSAITDWSTNVYPIGAGDITTVGYEGADYLFTVSPFAQASQIPKKDLSFWCPHSLYGKRCGVNVNDYTNTTVITDVDKSQRLIRFTLDKPADWLIRGYIEIENYKVPVLTSTKVGTTMSVQLREWPISTDDSDAIQIGRIIKTVPGCNKLSGATDSVGHCKNRFNNLPNFGGCPLVPDGNPANGPILQASA